MTRPCSNRYPGTGLCVARVGLSVCAYLGRPAVEIGAKDVALTNPRPQAGCPSEGRASSRKELMAE